MRFSLLLLLLVAACGDGDALPPAADAGECPATSSCQGVTGACFTAAGSTQFEDVRVGENGVANLIADVLREEGARAAAEPIDVAILNAGGIRGGRNLGPPTFAFTNEEARIGRRVCAGPVSDEDIRGFSPFANDHVVMTLTGAQLKRALEAGVRTWADDALLVFGPDLLRDRGGELLHVSGLSYEVTCPGSTRIRLGPSDCNPFQGTCMYRNPAVASSITRIEIGAVVIYDASRGGWIEGGDTRRIRVIMNSFIAAGLDGHLDFRDGTDRKMLPIAMFDFTALLVTRLRARSPLSPDGAQERIRVRGEVGGLRCNLPATCLPAHRSHPNCQHL